MTTRFRLNLPGFTIELEGQKTFVEDMYRAISRDLEPMLEAAAKGQPIKIPNVAAAQEEARSAASRRRANYIWVYLCTPLFNKVYVVENNVVENTPLGRFIDVERVRRVYIDQSVEASLLHLGDSNRTLWAEFTDEGRALLKKTLAKHDAQNSDGTP